MVGMFHGATAQSIGRGPIAPCAMYCGFGLGRPVTVLSGWNVSAIPWSPPGTPLSATQDSYAVSGAFFSATAYWSQVALAVGLSRKSWIRALVAAEDSALKMSEMLVWPSVTTCWPLLSAVIWGSIHWSTPFKVK